jgi:hypothetical protein
MPTSLSCSKSFSPIVVENFLSDVEFSSLAEEFKYLNWSLCNWSDSSNPFLFFGVPLTQRPQHLSNFASSVSLRTRKHLHSKLKFVRLHINGQVFGQEGQFHRDSLEPDFVSVLLFTNSFWDVCWGGGFSYIFPNTMDVKTVAYQPNRAVIFPSNMLHCGQSPSRCTDVFRTSVVFVFKRYD